MAKMASSLSQAIRAPGTMGLVAITLCLPKAIEVAFDALNAPNEGCDVRKILFRRPRTDVDRSFSNLLGAGMVLKMVYV
jgi:hypothetical protein